MLVAAAAFDVLGAAIRLMQQAEFDFEGPPPGREDLLAVWRIDRRISVDMIDGLAGATMPAAGDDLAKLCVQVLASCYAPRHDDLGRLTLLRF